ncbi:hypothetical protein [Pseudomonas laurylsulfatiphila]|uniref:hypothetical protein n=1 Tax=Pseudomonas laurylsulfatiphila TaxID=2011015 RepID=UPI003D24F0AF
MTNRNKIANGWATDVASEVTDPELDAAHPSGQGGTGKTAKGWISETEPHEWENYNIQLRESRVTAVAQTGRMPWDEEVTYKVGSLTIYLDIMYVAILGSNINRNPVTQTGWWSPVKFTSAAVHTATIADMQNKFTIHTPAGQNSHSDNIVSIGGSTKTTIDNQIKVVSDGLDAHIPLVNNPHVDTAIGVGTIPSTGGSFTGQVNYRDNLVLGTTCELMVNISTFVAFRSNAGAIGIGIADYSTGGRWQAILTGANFPEFNGLYNPTFVLPPPDVHFPLMSNLLPVNGTGESITFTRAGTLAYTDKNGNAQVAPANTPAFEVAGTKVTAGTTMLVDAPGLFGARDGCISLTADGAIFVWDLQFTSENIVLYFGAAVRIKNFRVWSQRLTPRQKLRIPR